MGGGALFSRRIVDVDVRELRKIGSSSDSPTLSTSDETGFFLFLNPEITSSVIDRENSKQDAMEAFKPQKASKRVQTKEI